MKEAYEQIAKDFDPSKVALMKQVAKDLINGDQIDYPEYTTIKKEEVWVIFRGFWVV